ncbi:tRNA-intron lyase [Halobellus ruber]|uniref:tRNA-splicing endonuclease n=1 Tax=Halobellus ruber TaxID=2761102 RepID=A0A7J9SJY8_9EURY|nr:tRNA-intron lyase [Halobellus ruber]MBB6647235.1 tRNA-intron lyase [Halobellus ruber]
MDGILTDGVVRIAGDARQRFHDAHGYGRPLDRSRIEVAPVEAAHLLSRGDLEAVVDESGADSAGDADPPADEDRLDFRAFLARTGTALRFTVYKDLRDRGFYLSPARPAWPGVDAESEGHSDVDFVVYPRGKGPWDDEVAHRVRVVGEREGVPAASLGGVVLAVVDEDGELTYFDTDAAPDIGADDADGTGDADLPASVDADLLDDRVVCYEAADRLYESRFYGQRLFGRNADSGPLQLSLVEAAYLAQRGVLDADPAAIVDRGQAVEGERFDRRLRVYAALRGRGVVPKSGFKFGADFRVYDGFDGVDSLGHSANLVRVVGPEHTVYPRDLSLDVRLAGGVRKRMVFARTAANGRIRWLSVARLTL